MNNRLLKVSALGLLLVLARMAHPQEPSATDLDVLYDEAQALMSASQYELAVEKFQRVVDQLPVSAKAQKAAFKAAACYEALQRPTDAVVMHERTVAIGRDFLKPRYYRINGQKRAVLLGKPDSVRDRLKQSLKRQAILCHTLGDSTKGLQAIRYLAAFAPTSPIVAEMIPLRLQFEARSASEAPTLIREQESAVDLCRQSEEAKRDSGREGAIPFLDRVLAEYPDSPAALRARADKAEILWLTKRYDESRQLYQQILDQTLETAPDTNAAREARYRIAWLDFGRLIKTSQRDHRAAKPVSEAQWQEIRDACKVVMELDPDPIHRAEANVALIEAYCWQEQYEEVLTAVSAFFRDYSGSRSAKGRLFRQMAWARLFKGIALEGLHRADAAAMEYRAILQWNAEHPDALRGERVVERASAKLDRIGGS